MATRQISKRSKHTNRTPTFCTTCGDALEAYCFAPEATDVKEMIKRLGKCKAEGRHQGRVCAKLFVGGTDDLYKNTTERRVPKRTLEGLKKAILREISKEANKGA